MPNGHDTHLFNLLAFILVLLALGVPVPLKEVLHFLSEHGRDAAVLYVFWLYMQPRQ